MRLEISRIDCEIRNDIRYARWVDLEFDHLAISAELLAEQPHLPKNLPWDLEEVDKDDDQITYRRTGPATGDFEVCFL